MPLNPIALAIPLFLLSIALELLVARARGRSVYRVQDALADLGCGIGQQVVLVLAGAALLACYGWVYDHLRVVTFPERSAVPWLIGFVGVDVTYYVWHRLSHEVNFLWAAHAVHHQSEDYNLAVALRQSILTSFTSLPFGFPLAVLGVPPAAWATLVAASTLYQFWIHTELVGKLGWLERFLNTPAHHRVHHAVNARYLDRNYGAILIVWDRLFGTFEEEREPAVYGTTKPLRSFNPLWAQLQTWFEIAEKARPLPRWRERAGVWFAPPSWSIAAPADLEEPVLRTRRKFEVALPPALEAYALAQFAPLVVATFVMLLEGASAPRSALAGAAVLVFWTLLSVGALIDGQRWGTIAELGRLATLGAAGLVEVAVAGGGRIAWAGAAAAVAATVSAAWLAVARRGGAREVTRVRAPAATDG